MNDPTYEIKTVADFLKVPEGRRGECLKTFAHFLSTAGATLEMTNAMADLFGADKSKNSIESFTWIDDEWAAGTPVKHGESEGYRGTCSKHIPRA